MRPFTSNRLLLAALCASSLVCASSPVTAAAQEARGPRAAGGAQLLFDFRTDRPAPPLVKIPAAEERAVLDATFPRRLRTGDECAPGATPSSDEDLAAQRAAGQVAPSVSETVRGSFTAPGRDETLHLIAVGECGDMPRSLGRGTTQLVIRRAGQNVVSLNGFYGNVTAVRDVDGDGAHELLMKTGGSGQGVLEESATLVSFADGRERTLHDFGEVFVDSCGMRDSPDAIRAGVLRFVPASKGAPARFLSDFYAARCYEGAARPRLKDFRFLKSGRLYD